MRKTVGLALVVLILMTIFVVVRACDPSRGKALPTASTSTTSEFNFDDSVKMPVYQWPPSVNSKDSSDSERAGRVTLLGSDLGGGWRSVYQGSDSPRALSMAEQLIQCALGEEPSALKAYQVSPVFVNSSNTTSIMSFTRATDSQARSVKDFESLNADRVKECQRGLQSLEKDARSRGQTPLWRSYGDARATDLSVAASSGPGDDSEVETYRYKVEPSDTGPSYVDLYGYGYGRYQSFVLVQGTEGHISNALAEQLVKLIKERTKTAAIAAG